MFEIEKKIKISHTSFTPGNTGWSSPSNIALVKYWGKRKNQLPENPSLSMGLEKSRTLTHVRYQYNPQGKLEWNFRFHKREAGSFNPKLDNFFKSIIEYLPFLNHLFLDIDSENTFPHSAGIASSASAMSALALCLLDIAGQLGNYGEYDNDFYRKASFLSRLGSGSAARSVYPGFSTWGQYGDESSSSDLYAGQIFSDQNTYFQSLKDAILIVSSDKKSVSSTVGHGLMKTNPYATLRYQHAKNNLVQLIHAMRSNDK